MRVFTKKEVTPKTEKIPVSTYGTIGEIREEKSDVYFLDHEATKVLVSDFPASARFVYIRFVPRIEWLLAIPGLIRRIVIGLVKVRGIEVVEHEGGARRWLVLEHLLTESLHTRLCVSEEVGVAGFLKYLNDASLNYVVLRFFEKLPKLYREGGDIDLLVSDEDEKTIKNFLQLNPGPIGVDVWTVSRTTFNDVTYYPPSLAKKILASAIDGPADARVPSPEITFLSFAYHVVYHKGPFAGVPSALSAVTVNKNPENDYAGVLKRMADELGIDIPITMESLDEYLHEHGWRPHLDTLAKIAPKNKWIWNRFFADSETDEVGLGVFIVKEKAKALGAVPRIREMITSYGDFSILEEKEFDADDVARVASSLRGGVWHGKNGPDDAFLPAVAILVLNNELARASQSGLRIDKPKHDIRTLKRMIREEFDEKDGSIIHATDNTRETWEYVPVCFPDEDMRTRVAEAVQQRKPSPLSTLKSSVVLFPRTITYQLTKFKRSAKHAILGALLKI